MPNTPILASKKDYIHREGCREGFYMYARWYSTLSTVLSLYSQGITKGYELTFGGTEGSMLGRRGWFDALTKSMV